MTVVKNKNRLSRILALKPLRHPGCGKANSAFETVAATVNLGGAADFGFSISGFWIGGRHRSFFCLVIFLSFLSFYRAAGLACCTVIPLVLPRGWLGMDLRRACSASFPLFYRAVGLGPDLFDFSPRLDERRRRCFAARQKKCSKNMQPDDHYAHHLSSRKNPSVRLIDGQKPRVSSAVANLRQPIGTGVHARPLLNS